MHLVTLHCASAFFAKVSYQNPSILKRAQSDCKGGIYSPKCSKITSNNTWHLTFLTCLEPLLFFFLIMLNIHLTQIYAENWSFFTCFMLMIKDLSNALLTYALMAFPPFVFRKPLQHLNNETTVIWNNIAKSMLYLCKKLVF